MPKIVNPFPLNTTGLFIEKRTDDIFGLCDGKVHIFEQHVVFAKVAQNVGVSGWVLEEFSVLDHLKVVIVLVYSVQRDLVRGGHVPTRCIPHSNNKIIDSRQT
jgi:hypothetical protein